MQLDGRPDAIQRQLAEKLCIKVPEDVTWGELELLIIEADPEQVIRNKPGEQQMRLAHQLGIEVAEGRYTGRYLSALIDAELALQSDKVLAKNPNIKVGNRIVYEGEAYYIRELGTIRFQPYRARLVGPGGRQRVVLIVFLADVVLAKV